MHYDLGGVCQENPLKCKTNKYHSLGHFIVIFLSCRSESSMAEIDRNKLINYGKYDNTTNMLSQFREAVY